jgi:hypothetical protein
MEPVVDDPFQEARWRQDDIESFGIDAIPTNKDAKIADAELDVKKSNINVSLADQLTNISWKHWKRHWRHQMKMLKYKIDALEKQGPINDWVRGYFSVKTNQILDFQPPEEYFSPYERTIFRALICTNPKDWLTKETSDWYTLPGPAEWWPEEYDFAGNGWDVDCSRETAYQKALDLFIESSQPADYSDLVLGTDEFQVVGKWTLVEF